MAKKKNFVRFLPDKLTLVGTGPSFEELLEAEKDGDGVALMPALLNEDRFVGLVDLKGGRSDYDPLVKDGVEEEEIEAEVEAEEEKESKVKPSRY